MANLFHAQIIVGVSCIGHQSYAGSLDLSHFQALSQPTPLPQVAAGISQFHGTQQRCQSHSCSTFQVSATAGEFQLPRSWSQEDEDCRNEGDVTDTGNSNDGNDGVDGVLPRCAEFICVALAAFK
jgi:hypothetical protein